MTDESTPRAAGGAHILVIEDEARIASFLKVGLEAEGFTVDVAGDGETGLQMALAPTIDLILLDLMLPGLSGEDVLRQLRASRPAVPVIVLTARDAEGDRVTLLDGGADDYIVKPFGFAELAARVRTRLRAAELTEVTKLTAGRVTLDLRARRATLDGHTVALTTREFTLLETLVRHPNEILSQGQLLTAVWGDDFDSGSNVVEVYVACLRKKLRPDVIETVRSAGYRFRG